MTALTGTNTYSNVGSGALGTQRTITGTYALAGALVAADTITWSKLLPLGGGRVVRVELAFPELDTDTTPTGTWKVGDGTDDDGYILLSNIGLPAQAPANGLQMVQVGTGALIGTVVTGRDVVLTVVGTMATSATTGTILLNVTLESVAA